MKTTGSRASAVSQTRGFGDLLYDKAGARPSLDLDFAGTESLRDKISGDYLVDHTRASSGTYIDSEGLVKEAAVNFNFDHRYAGSRSGEENQENPEGEVTLCGFYDISAGSSKLNTLLRSGTASSPRTGNVTGSIYLKTDQGTASVEIDCCDRNVQSITVTDQWQRFSASTVGQVAAASSNHEFLDLVILSTTGTPSKLYTWGVMTERKEDATPADVIKNTVAGGGAPRFTHERVETGNLLTQSEELQSDWSMGANMFRAGRTIAPDGTYSAKVFGSDGSGGFIYLFQSVALKANTTYTASVYAKLISGSVPTGGSILAPTYHNGSTTTRASVVYNGNLTSEWKRIEVI